MHSLGELTTTYLRRCRYSAAQIEACTSDTRLLHDLGLCGDDVWDEFEILHRDFGVDLSEFKFEDYFPGETSWGALIITARRPLRAIGLGRVVDRVYSRYREVTLSMIEETLRQRKWVSSL